MKVATVGELKKNLNKILSVVEHGDSVRILRKDVPIARLVPYKPEGKKNRTVLGSGKWKQRSDYIGLSSGFLYAGARSVVGSG